MSKILEDAVGDRLREEDRVKNEKLHVGYDTINNGIETGFGSDTESDMYGSDQNYEDENQAEDFGSTTCNNLYGSDQIIDNYILMIEHSRAENDKISLALYTTTHYMRCMSKPKRLGKNDKLSIAKKAENWREHDMVLFPMIHDRHWFVGVLHFAKEKFQILDSKPKSADSYDISTRELRLGIRRSFKALAELKSADLNFEEQDICKWPVQVIKNLPRQMDSDSCGIFTLKYMQFWDGEGLSQSFSQTDILALRKQMTAELIISPDNRIADVRKEIHELVVGKGFKVGDFKA